MGWQSFCCISILALCLCLGCAHKEKEVGARSADLAASMSGGTPVLELTEIAFDFGSLKDDGEYVHDFKVKNSGNGVLQIKKVLPG